MFATNTQVNNRYLRPTEGTTIFNYLLFSEYMEPSVIPTRLYKGNFNYLLDDRLQINLEYDRGTCTASGFTQEEPLVEMQKVRTIKIKVGTVNSLKFESVEDQNGFL
jgi:hypothetical protein